MKKKEIYMCEECSAVFNEDVRKNNDGWGHICKAKKFRCEHRCESYLHKYKLEKEN